jgi:hypothetical protein
MKFEYKKQSPQMSDSSALHAIVQIESYIHMLLHHREIMYFIETKARCSHPLFGQF